MHHKHKPPTGNFRWAVSFYGRLKAEAGTHSVRVITSANQIVIADMGVEELLHRHIAVNPDLRAAKIILVQIFDNLAGRDKVVTQIRAGLEDCHLAERNIARDGNADLRLKVRVQMVFLRHIQRQRAVRKDNFVCRPVHTGRICCIVSEYNFFRKELKMAYNEIELETGIPQL